MSDFYKQQQTSEEGLRVQQSKHCDGNNEDASLSKLLYNNEDASPITSMYIFLLTHQL